MRVLWRHYYPGTNGLVFVVDSNDRDRIEDVREQLQKTLHEEDLKDAALLVLCNKQDVPNVLTPAEITEKLRLHTVCRDRKWFVQGCCALTGDGLWEGFDWLSQASRAEQQQQGKKDEAKKREVLEEKKYDAIVDAAKGQKTGLHNHHRLLDRAEREQEKARSRLEEEKKRAADNLKDDLLSHSLGYDPSSQGNLALQRFAPIRRGTECPFAKAAKLWGSPPSSLLSPAGYAVSLEFQAANSASALAEFVRRSEADEGLDGFVLELDDDEARRSDENAVEAFGECVRRALLALSDEDPAGEARSVMRSNSIGSRSWHFRFAKASFFITTFAPCYPSSSSRFAFGAGRAFILLQPERSFLRHGLPADTPETNWEAPTTVRDKVRCAFRAAGRGYLIPPTTRYPMAPHIVKPLKDVEGAPEVKWWEEAETDAGSTVAPTDSEMEEDEDDNTPAATRSRAALAL